MMTARKRVGLLPTHSLAVRHFADHSSLDSSSEASSDFHLDASSDPSLRHPLSDHSSPDLSSTSAGPSRKRRRSPMTSVPALSHLSGALSPVHANLIPWPKRVRDSGYSKDVEVDPRETSLRDDAIVRVNALRDRGIDARVVVEAIGRDETKTSVRGPVEAIEGVQREQGHRIVGVESAVIALTERLAELERDNMRLRGTASVESQRIDRLQKMPSTRSGASMTREEFEELARTEEIEIEEMEMEGMEDMETEMGIMDSALTWWNYHKRTIGVEAAYAMNWVELMKLMTEVYRPRNEIQKMETELWNLTMKGNDLTAYTQRFQELILLCTRMVPDEEDRVERFIGGLPNNIQGNVIAGYAARSAENKRRMESNLRDNRGQLPPFKRQNTSGQNVARAYTAGNNERRGYAGPLPYCNKCKMHHEGLCTIHIVHEDPK
ncbi:reverse transcriptase domain-containing protein, partial [Tanacetum coccineum]